MDARIRRAGAGFLPVLAALVPVLLAGGCADGPGASWGGACTTDDECPRGGVCGSGTCRDPSGDDDRDGLPNGLEVRLGTDPARVDTDGDGRPDPVEVGADPTHPADSDGDGRIDALESATADADRDCVFDQFDPRDGVADATSLEIARTRCESRGVCGAHPEAILASCSDGVPSCDLAAVPGWRPTEDRCDDLDNDCDGRTDDTFDLAGMPVGLACQVPGACGTGRVECTDDGLGTRCSSGPGGSRDGSGPEACNGRDDDCDGVTDEGLALADSPCPKTGACALGEVATCADGAWSCDSTAVAGYESPEVSCDGIDNDCDGETDEDVPVPLPGVACVLKGVCTGQPEKVAVACRDGRITCDFSAVEGWSGTVEAACDGRDENCDGQVDDGAAFRYADPVQGLRWLGQSCGSGACAGGAVVCSADGAAGTCSTLVRASPEACNGQDDDCNGRVDDGVDKAFAAAPVQVGVGEPRTRVVPAVAAADFPGQGAALYLYGGAASIDPAGRPGEGLSDFWRYDPQAHRFMRLGGGDPGPRAGGVLLSDPLRARLVLAGGVAAEDAAIWLWRLEAGAWTHLPGVVPQRWVVGGALDPVTGRLVLLRGDPSLTTLTRVSVDLETGAWEEVGVKVPFLKDAASTAAPDGTILLAGGLTRDGVPNPALYAVSPAGEARVVPVASGVPVRMRHALTMLPDGALLLAGGVGADLKPAAEVLRIRPGSDETWVVEPAGALPPPGGVSWPALAVAGGTTYLAGGLGADGRGVRQVLRFDGKGAWHTDLLTLLPTARSEGAMVVLPSLRSAWLFGGAESDLLGDRPVSDLWRMSLDDLSFQPVSPQAAVPVFVGGAAAADPGTGDVYLYGGWTDLQDPTSLTARFLRFRTASLEVEVLPGTPGARGHSGLVWTGDGLLLYAGEGPDRTLGDVWRWTATSGWGRIEAPDRPADRPEVFWDAATARLIAAGGTLPSADVAAFDPATGAWTHLSDLPGYLDAGGAVSFLDEDSRTLVFLSAGSGGVAIPLDDPGAAVSLASPPPPAASFHAFDPLGRRGLIFGGLRQDLPVAEVSSALWILPERCPE